MTEGEKEAGSETQRGRSTSPDEPDFTRLLNRSITTTLRQAVRLVLRQPSLALFATGAILRQGTAAKVRRQQLQEGIQVPPVLIFSVTSRCNLSCSGCYMRARGHAKEPDLSDEELRSVISQAAELGVSFVVFAGGEPLIRKEVILKAATEFPGIIFAIFTNGILIDAATADSFAGRKNIVPFISFEGGETETDSRRGEGTYREICEACSNLKKRGIFFGCSLTVTRDNFERVTNGEFVRSLTSLGARVLAFVEYVPLEVGTENLVLAETQRTKLLHDLEEFPKKFPAVFLGFPGDDAQFGGCLSAGRGFLHISASGDLEACPAAPFSDTNLKRNALKKALMSEYLERVRNEHGILTESQGGCALWANRTWTASLLK